MGAKNAITPSRAEDYPNWYQQVIRAAELAELSSVRGCMIIKPWGYAIWERLQGLLDARLKALGVENAYFPLLIPKSLLEKEAAHVQGFSKECAVVTHTRLCEDGEGGLRVDGALEEPLVVRPTSEVLIGEAFAKWVQSYRDLPMRINQWANVMRWEMRTRMFLRTSEFLWQEGHTVHSSKQEALEQTLEILNLYADFAKNVMAMPVIMGEKTEAERFPGAERTFCIEAMMQDGKALQAGTSHFLGQHFAKASGMEFLDEKGATRTPWTSSWGVSTRLIGGLIMTHADDDGLVLPPSLAPLQVVILPIIRGASAQILEAAEHLKAAIEAENFQGEPIRAKVDARDLRGGQKYWHWVKKGLPLVVELGARELEAGKLSLRVRGVQGRGQVELKGFASGLPARLEAFQKALLAKAEAFQKAHYLKLDTQEEVLNFFKPQGKTGVLGGFCQTYWAGDAALERKLAAEHQISIRCVLQTKADRGLCPFTGKDTENQVVFARSY